MGTSQQSTFIYHQTLDDRPLVAYLIYMDTTSKQQLAATTFEITGLGGKTVTRVKAKSIWRAYETAVLTGDILVFESIATKRGN